MSTDQEKKKRRPRREYPIHSLQEALRVAQAIQDENNGRPFKRILLASSINRKPMSSEFREILSSSFKYGLTLGTEKAENISLTDLGRSIVKPRDATEKARGLIEAALKPELFRNIYERYRNGKFPQGQFFTNILEVDFNVASPNNKEVAARLTENGRFVQIIRDVQGSPYVLLEPEQIAAEEVKLPEAALEEAGRPTKEEKPPTRIEEEVRVFISHGKNKRILDQVKTMLEFGKYDYEVAAETETTAIPVPQKIQEAMRRCSAGIIIVSADEQERLENDRYGINSNVLIEIGAAFVLYDRRVVLVVDRRVDLPSNLQGLYRCEYKGDELSWEAGIKLQEAITEFRASTAASK
ncbi:hypothetical protein ES703_98302 [subsurface metagenome]